MTSAIQDRPYIVGILHFEVLADHSIRCGTGMPPALACDSLEGQFSTRTNNCLTGGVYAGVRQVRDRVRYTMDSDLDHWEGCRHTITNGPCGSQRRDFYMVLQT